MQNNTDPGGPTNLPPDLTARPSNSAANLDGNPGAVEKERKAFLTAEEEEIWAATDLNTDRKNSLVALLRSRARLLETNVHLQLGLNGSEDTCAQLEASNSELKAQLKSTQVSMRAIEALKLEMDEVKAALAQSEQDLGSSQAKNIHLQRETKLLKETVEAKSIEVSDISYQRRMDKEIMTYQKHRIKALKAELRGAMLAIGENAQVVIQKNVLIRDQEVTIEELKAIEQVRREKIQDLEEQLELALIHGGGSIMTDDGSVSVGTNRLSLAEEMMNCALDLENNKPENKAVCIESNAKTATAAHLDVSAMKRAEATGKHMDLTAEGSGQANGGDNNNMVQVEKSRPFHTALVVTGVVGLGLFALWRMKS